jgi:class 3 adenylate cyclase/tetratricopeptide (TPR) repeat protein
MAGERRSATATVLFTDLVGSTELLARLGDAAFDELRRSHFATLRQTVARADGEEVKTLGDGVLAVFSSSASALACAVAMQQAVDREARSSSGPLAVRVGLALGDVLFEEDDVFGTPVVEAARLVATAKGGQILATALVRAAAGARTDVEFVELGPVALKGLSAAVSTCEVLWRPVAVSGVPLPPFLTGGGLVFVGRQPELDRLEGHWNEAAAGKRRVVLVGGEPGIGKTRLASELARAVHEEGASVLAGRCDEDLGVPYQPFVEALRHYIRANSEPGCRLGRYAGELTRLVPELADCRPELSPPLRSDPETERYRLFDAIAAWLAAASEIEPLLVVLDDLQWAAKPTLLLLRHVARSSDPMRLLLLGTYRDTELDRAHPLMELTADLRRDGTLECLSLSGLDPSGVVAFVEQTAGHTLETEEVALAQAIHDETDGNPFFVEEVLRHLAETGAVLQRDGRWVAVLPIEELGIPEGVRDVVRRRLAKLSQSANRALSTAAVVGQEFDLPMLEAAAGLGEDDLLSGLDEAMGARLIVEIPGSRYRFAHALVRDTIYHQLSGPARVGLHRRVARAIELVHGSRLDDHLPALAHHYGRASSAAETERAVYYAARAGERALAQLAHDEAASYFRQALHLLTTEGPEDEGQRGELLILLGEAQRRAGDPGHRETLLEAARLAMEGGDADALTRAALVNSRGTIFSAAGTVDAEKVAVLEAALQAVGPADSPARARLLALLSLELCFAGDWKRRVRLSDEALAMARRLEDPATLANVLLTRYNATLLPGTLRQRHAESAELVGVAERLGDPATTCRAAWCRYRTAMELADVDEADQHLEAVERLSSALGQPVLRWITTWSRAGRILYGGQIEEAERLIGQGLELGRTAGQPDAPVYFAAQQFLVRFEQGRLGEVEGLLTESSAYTPGYSLFPALLAQLYCELGREDMARAHFERLAASSFSALLLDVTWLRTVATCAAVASHLGDRARAAALHERLVPYPEHLPIAGGVALGSVGYHLGMLATTLGHFDEAEARFAAASDLHDRSRAPTWLARTLLEWARMLLTRGGAGDAQRAGELLGQTLATARGLSLAGVERQAVALIQLSARSRRS